MSLKLSLAATLASGLHGSTAGWWSPDAAWRQEVREHVRGDRPRAPATTVASPAALRRTS